MDQTDGMKLVEFEKYCPTCKHKDIKEEEQPCHDCLTEPANQYSHKPVNYEEKERPR